METLGELHSRILFFKRIFGSEDHCPDMLKKVSSEILKKCGGLPLAIISISSLLASKPIVREEWEKVKRSIGYALENNQSLEGINSILSLSYNDLPPNLKTCLLYLSVFPEDYEIERERLVRLWIAEGFISEERGKSQYEVAESYFYELINKSMVQPLGLDYTGEVRACRVHDMMLEIIISKSAEDNFIIVVGGGQKSLLNHRGIIRRLSVQYIDQELAFALAKEDLSHVRSLTVTSSDCIKHLPTLAEFEALRVLDLEGCIGLEQYGMNSVKKLFQLKYLGLRRTYISRLPSGIVMLSDLETLDFRGTYVQELPARFVQLAKLRHLLAGRETKIPSGIGNMKNLRVISEFNATTSPADALEELGNLTCLRELCVHLNCEGSRCRGPDAYRTHEEKLFSSLHKLIMSCELRYLYIYSNDGHSLEFLESWSPMPSALQTFIMTTSYYFTNIPKWIAPALTSLASLVIKVTELSEDGLHTLGELPALLRLILTIGPVGYRITVQGVGFPSLMHFELTSTKGINVTFLNGAMPKLEFLDLTLAVSVGRNDDFYLGLVHLPCLKLVYIAFDAEVTNNSEVIAARAAIQEEADAHTNHPSIRQLM
jgi:disease resistance protein RPM1